MPARKIKPSLYFSIDIEADGPIPGPYSMISFGVAVAGRQDAGQYAPEHHAPTGEPAADRGRTFYRELRPISADFVPEALAVSGLDRDRLCTEGADPATALVEFSSWVESIRGGAQAVMVGYPAPYDWMFLYWYRIRFTGASPFGHSRCMDVKTLFAAKAGVPLGSVGKHSMPHHLLSKRRHTHHALEDAIEQAELFSHLMLWPGPTGAGHADAEQPRGEADQQE